MPPILLTHRQFEAARRDGARSRGLRTPEAKNAFHALLQSLVDRSKLLQFLAVRESPLTFQRQAVLNQLCQLRRDWLLPAPPPQSVESEPVDSEIPAANEPETNPQSVDSIEPPLPAEPGEIPEMSLP